MSVNTFQFSHQPDRPELEAMAEALLRRVRDGLVIGLALVEHRCDDDVALETFGPESYHHLNSGAVRLSHFLASQYLTETK